MIEIEVSQGPVDLAMMVRGPVLIPIRLNPSNFPQQVNYMYEAKIWSSPESEDDLNLFFTFFTEGNCIKIYSIGVMKESQGDLLDTILLMEDEEIESDLSKYESNLFSKIKDLIEYLETCIVQKTVPTNELVLWSKILE